MRRQLWRRITAVVGIVTLLTSNVTDAMTAQAAVNIPGGLSYATVSAPDYAGSELNSAYSADPDTEGLPDGVVGVSPASGSNATPASAVREIVLSPQCVDADENSRVITGHEKDALLLLTGCWIFRRHRSKLRIFLSGGPH